MGAAFAIGELVAAIVAYIMLDDLESGNWRGATAWLCIPGIASFVYLMVVFDEPSRYLYLNDAEE